MGTGGLELVEAAFKPGQDSLTHLGTGADLLDFCISRLSSRSNVHSNLVNVLFNSCQAVLAGKRTVAVSSIDWSCFTVSRSIAFPGDEGCYHFVYQYIDYEREQRKRSVFQDFGFVHGWRSWLTVSHANMLMTTGDFNRCAGREKCFL